jgi:hypothetical protein
LVGNPVGLLMGGMAWNTWKTSEKVSTTTRRGRDSDMSFTVQWKGYRAIKMIW